MQKVKGFINLNSTEIFVKMALLANPPSVILTSKCLAVLFQEED